MDYFRIDESAAPPACAVFSCTKRRAGRYRFCRRCRDRRYKATNPLSYSYDKLRWSAKKRGISFLLTIAEFGVFCEETGYLSLSGTGQEDMTVDRIKSDRGYEVGNLRMAKKIDNGWKSDRPDMEQTGSVEPDDGRDPFGND